MGLANTTTYRVETIYSVDDKATKALDKIAAAADRAGRSTGGLSSGFGRLGGIVAGGFAFGAAKSALIDFNSNLEQSKIQLAGIASISKRTSFASEFDRAGQSLTVFQKMAKESALTTGELVQMASRLQLPLSNAGVSQQKFHNLVFASGVAAKAFGFQFDVAARDVQEALMGNLTKTSIFMRSLIEPRGLTTDKFNKMSADKRLGMVESVLDSPQLKEMAAAQANTWEGVTSALKDNLQMALGKVGLPLFKALTEEVKRWNSWLDSNQGKVEEFGKTLADGLVTGFRTVKDAIGFLVENKETLLTLGKVWLVARGAGAVGEIGGSLAGGAGMLRKSVGGSGGIGMAGAAGPLGAAFGVGWMIGTELRPAVDRLTYSIKTVIGAYDVQERAMRRQEELQNRVMEEQDRAREKAEKSRKGLFGSDAGAASLGEANTMMERAAALRGVVANRNDFNSGRGLHMNRTRNSAALIRRLGLDDLLGQSVGSSSSDQLLAAAADQESRGRRMLGLESASRGLAITTFHEAMSRLTPYQRETLQQDKAQSQLMYRMLESLAKGNGVLNPFQVDSIIKKFTDDPLGQFKRKKDPPTNINVAKVEVAAKDPDRWIADFHEKVGRKVRNRTQARSARRRGGA